MEELDTIKDKIQQFINEFESIDNISPDEAFEKFRQMFENEYFEENKYENSPYYKSYRKTLYLKNGCGIGIEKIWGPGDIAGGGLTSHHGRDVYIFSRLADKCITLFDESERNNKLEDSKELYDIDLSFKNILDIDDDFVFKCLPDNVKNDDNVISERYRKLKIDAEIHHDNDIEDDLISYYGGLDVTIQSTEYYLYESLAKHIEDTYFMGKAIPLFIKDFPNYIDEQIDICEHALYMIENKEKYYEWVELDEKVFSFSSDFNQLEIFKANKTKEKGEYQLELNESLEEYKKISEKKYNLIELLRGKRKDDKIKLNNIQTKIDTLKSKLTQIEKDLNEAEIEYKDFEKQEESYKKQKQELSLELERKFKDFTLNLDIDDMPYIKGEYYLEVSLDRLVEQEDEYREKLAELQQMKSFITKSIEESKEQEKNIEYEY